ncbi:hypothetical protein [Phocaeicola sp.]
MARLVREWKGKAIAFPSYCIFTVQGKDTVDFAFPRSDYKVVTYVDSIGCYEELYLRNWRAFINEVDSLTDDNVHFVFYFNVKDKQRLQEVTLRDKFTYPVCFDEKDQFNDLNQFSKDLHIQTFLLDEYDKVITIGNPVNDPEVEKSYMQIIASAE